MFTIKGIKNLGKSGVRWVSPSETSSGVNDLGLESAKKELQWLKDTSNHTDSAQTLRALDRIRDAIKRQTTRNDTQKKSINDQFDAALGDNSGFSPEAKIKIKELKNEFERDFSNAGGLLEATKDQTKTTIGKTIQVQQNIVETSVNIKDNFRKKFDEKLNYNDAIIAILGNFDAFNKFSQNDAYPSNSQKETPLTELLDKQGYLARNRFPNGQNNYNSTELKAVLDMRDELVGNPKLLNELKKVKFQESVKINDVYDPKNKNDITARLFDFSGDKALTSYNAKEYSSNVLYAIFQKAFDGGRDAQLRVSPELAAYQLMMEKHGKNIDTLVAKISDITGDTPGQINSALRNEKTAKVYMEKFQRLFLIEVNKYGYNVAIIKNKSERQKIQTLEAAESVATVKKIQEDLKKEGLGKKIENAFEKGGYPNVEANKIEDIMGMTALRLYSLNPQFYSSIGANTSVTETNTKYITHIRTVITDVSIVQDHNGNETSRTTTTRDGGTETSERTEKNSDTKVTPTLVVGFNQNIFGYEKEGFSAKAQAGIGAIASPDGIVFPITLSANAEATASDNNARLQTGSLKGNFLFGGTIRGTYADGKFVPSLGIDINHNDVANSVNEQRKKFDTLLKTIKILGDGKLDIIETLRTLDENEKSAKDTKDEGARENALMEVQITKKLITDLKEFLDTNDATSEEKKMLLAMNASKIADEYLASVRSGVRGMHFAGINISFVPMFHALFLGVNIQNIQQIAKKTTNQDSERRDLRNTESVLTLPQGIIVSDNRKSLIISNDFKKQNQLTFNSDIVQNVSENGDITIDPPSGMRLKVAKMVNYKGEGEKHDGFVFSTEKAPVTDAQAPTPSPKPGVPPPNTIPKQLDNNAMYDANLFTAAEQNLLRSVSRNQVFIKTVANKIAQGAYVEAMSGLSKFPGLEKIAEKISAEENQDNRNALLRAVLIPGSGSEAGRKIVDSMTQKQYNTLRSSKIDSAMVHRYLESLPKGVMPADKKQFEATLKSMYEDMKNGITTKVGESTDKKIATKSLASLINKNEYADLSGSITNSRVNTQGKLVMSTPTSFHGSPQVINNLVSVSDGAMQDNMINQSIANGTFKSNFDSVNKFLTDNKKTNLSVPEYKEFLKTGSIEDRKDLEGKPALFLYTQNAEKGATCTNDVFALAFPRITIKGVPGVPPATSTPFTTLDSPVFSEASSGDHYVNAGIENQSAIGLNISSVSEIVSNVVTNNVVNNVTTTTTTKTPPPPIVIPPGGTEEPPPSVNNGGSKPSTGGTGSGSDGEGNGE